MRLIVTTLTFLVLGAGLLLTACSSSYSRLPSPTPIGPAPITDNSLPSDWKTYYSGKYGYTIGYPADWELEAPKSEEPSISPKEEQVAGINVNSHALNDEEILVDFATRYRDFVKERYHLNDTLNDISFIEEERNGINFYRLTYRKPGTGDSCDTYEIADIVMSYAFPAKPYGYIVTAGVCEHSLREFRDESEMMLDSFQEWNYHFFHHDPKKFRGSETRLIASETDTHYGIVGSAGGPNNYLPTQDFGWGFSSAPGWTIVDNSFSSNDISGMTWNEDNDKGVFSVRMDDMKDKLSEFAYEHRTITIERASEHEWPVFEEVSFEPIIHWGSEVFRFTYRYQPTPQSCIIDVAAMYAITESISGDRYIISSTGELCEHSLDELGPSRDGMIDSIRP